MQYNVGLHRFCRRVTIIKSFLSETLYYIGKIEVIDMGKVMAVCLSREKGTQKENVHTAKIITDWGIENDAHAGKWHRQISLLSYEIIEEFKKKGAPIQDGSFGENLIVSGFDFKALPVGTRFQCNDVVLEMTQIGKECHSGCEIFKIMGDCIMPREGVFAKVIHGGTISEGDTFSIVKDSVLTHFDEQGNAIMVDVSDKNVTRRIATASGKITVNAEVMKAVLSGDVAKGDVLGVARIAGIMGTKQTSGLIPLCHPLPLTKCEVNFEINKEQNEIVAYCTVKTEGKTGVEMEALTGVSITLLTIYDMCKAIDKGMEISNIRLEEKHGGKSGDYVRV